MATAKAMKKVEKIRQIVRLKQIMLRWKLTSTLRDRLALAYDGGSGGPTRRTPSGFIAVYVGPERRRFVNLPIFVDLLEMAAEEFGFETTGGLVLPCDVAFFEDILKFLQKDEGRFSKLPLDGFFKMLTTKVGKFDCSCKESSAAAGPFTPLLQQKAEA